MATLLVATANGGVIQRLPLDPTRGYWLGRSPRCDIPLEPGSISRRHAVLFPHAGTWWVADAGSTRGLRVESGPTRFAPLSTEQWVAIGPLVLWLLPTGTPAARPKRDDSRSDGRVDPYASDPCDESIEVESGQAEESEPSQLLAIATADPLATRHIDLSAVQCATVGTDVACSIRLQQPEIAPLHAVLIREPRRWAIVAAQGAISTGSERFLRKRLDPGSRVRVGSCELQVVVPERLTPPTADEQRSFHVAGATSPAHAALKTPTKPAGFEASIFLQPDNAA